MSTNERPRTKEGQTRELRFGPALLFSSGEHKLDNLEREKKRERERGKPIPSMGLVVEKIALRGVISIQRQKGLVFLFFFFFCFFFFFFLKKKLF